MDNDRSNAILRMRHLLIFLTAGLALAQAPVPVVIDGGTIKPPAADVLTALGVGGGISPADATYITQTANGTLTAEQALGSLATGVLKNTTTSGVLSIAAQGTDYWAPGGTDVAVADGGTGASTLTGLLQGNGTSAITGISNSSTVGQTLRVTGASTYAWGALDLADTDAITGTLPVANGGTGAATLTSNNVLLGNGTSAVQVVAPGTSGNVLTSNGTTWDSSAAASSSLAIQVFTASGTYTPTSGMKFVRVRVQAPGGGGGGGDGVGGSATYGCTGGGGGGGEYAEGIFSAATIGASQAVTIGAVGSTGSNTGGDGGTGGTTSVGSLITAIGGTGGTGSGSDSTSSAVRAGGAGGAGGTGGSVRIPGQKGGYGGNSMISDTLTYRSGGQGGDSKLGLGEIPQQTSSSGSVAAGGIAGGDYGGGGCGANANITTGQTGGAGGAGIIIIEEFL